MKIGWVEIIVGAMFSLNVGFIIWIRVTLSLMEEKIEGLVNGVSNMNGILTKGDASNFGYMHVRDRMEDVNDALKELVQYNRQANEKIVEAVNQLTIAIKELQATIKRNGRS